MTSPAAPVAQGDSPSQLAVDFGKNHGLGDDGVVSVAKHITAKAGNYLKRVFFYYPFYVEVEGKSQMMNLTVYEDSDPAELGKKVAEKYGLPETSAERLRVAIQDEFLQRVKLKVNVDLAEMGIKKLMLVLRDDTAESAARRFAIQNGISAAGQLVRARSRRSRPVAPLRPEASRASQAKLGLAGSPRVCGAFDAESGEAHR